MALRSTLLALALCLAAGRPAAAQHALVLSGGGARGLAHAGVVAGAEQLGFTFPVVVGTSMGAIIGALYAAGYSPAEIWATVAGEDWSALFAGDAVLIGPQREARRPLLSVAFAQGNEPVLEGFVPETGINRRLVMLLFDAGVRAGNDFDSLPRRFRAVAADLRTGRAVVLGRGDLARATRASMAVPGAFSPVRWDDERVLVDGGIADNLPISVARALAPLPVLAVDVVRPAGELEETSALAIGLRAVRLLLHNTRGARDSAELLVVPRIPPELTEATFPADARPLLQAGYEAALAQLHAAADPPVERPVAAAPATLDAVRVEGGDRLTRALVARTFRRALGPYEPARVLDRMDALYATGLFHGVWPRVERDSAGAHVLVVRAEPVARTLASGAAGWDNDLGVRGWAAVRTRVNLGSPLELRTAASADRMTRWVAGSASFYSTLLPPWVLSAGGHVRDHRVRMFRGSDVDRTVRVRRTGGWLATERLDLAPELSLTLLLRGEAIDTGGGPRRAALGPLLRIGALPAADPLIGLDNRAEVEVRFGSAEYARADAAGSIRASPGPLRVAVLADVATVHGRHVPADVVPFLGGRRAAPWLRYGEGRGQARVLAGIDVAYPVLLEGHLRLRLRTGAAAAALDTLLDEPWTWGGEAGAVWSTAVGPLAAGLALGRGGRWRVQLGIGPEW